MPENTVAVTRGTPFGNPFTVQSAAEVFDCGRESAHRFAVDWFRQWLACSDGEQFESCGAYAGTQVQRGTLLRRMGELRGKNLACFCAPDMACHADVLLELANAAAKEPAA
jgi:hypothetical protein